MLCCAYNYLVNINYLPDSLVELVYSHNNIESINIPGTFIKIYCTFNLIKIFIYEIKAKNISF